MAIRNSALHPTAPGNAPGPAPKKDAPKTAEDNVKQAVTTTNKAVSVLKDTKVADALEVMGNEAVASQIRDGVVGKVAAKASALTSLGFVATNTSQGSLDVLKDTKNVVDAADVVTRTRGVGKVLSRGATGLGVAVSAASLKDAVQKTINGEADFAEAKTILTTSRDLTTAATTAGKAIAKYSDDGVKVAKVAVKAGKGASGVATKVATKTGAKTAAKSAGRFVPGMNAAIAVVDTGIAAMDIKEAVKKPTPKNVAKAALGSITAAGSIASASNVPVVSQVGAGVAVVSDVAKVAVDVDWKQVKKDTKKVATKTYKKASQAANRAYNQGSNLLNNTVKSMSGKANAAWTKATSWW